MAKNITEIVYDALEDGRLEEYQVIQQQVSKKYSPYALCHDMDLYKRYVQEIQTLYYASGNTESISFKRTKYAGKTEYD